jgi:hypothetical protein
MPSVKTVELDAAMAKMIDDLPAMERNSSLPDKEFAVVHRARQRGVSWMNIMRFLRDNGMTTFCPTTLKKYYEQQCENRR